jgi:very-short-patch-repair endonuclease
VPETKLRLALGRQELPEPELRYVVQDSTGWELAWPDLAFPRYKVAVNYDGDHHLTAAQKESDIRRDEAIAAIGWTSVTITARHVKAWGFDGVVHRVRDALIRAGWVSET